MTVRSLISRLGSGSPHVGTMWLNVSVLASGSVLAQGITILGAPVLTRYFTPDEFGVFATISALTGILGGVSALSYDTAVPLARSDREAVALVGLSCAASFTLFAAVFAALAAYLHAGMPIHFVPASVELLLWVIPWAVILTALYEVAKLWCIRQKRFARLSGVEIFQRVSTLGAQIGAGILGYGAAGLVLSMVGGTLLSLVALTVPATAKLVEAGRGLTLKIVRAAAWDFRRMPLFACPSEIVFSNGRYAPLLILPWFFGATTTGLYALTERVLQTPLAFIGTHIQTVFLSSCTELKNNGRLGDTALSMLETLVRFSLPTFAIVALVAPDAFPIVFGENWRVAGEFARLLTPYIFSFFIALPFNSLPLAFNRQREELYFQGGITIARCAAILVGGALGRIDLTIGLMSLIGVIGWLSYLFWTMSLIGRQWAAVRILLRETVVASPFLAAAILAETIFASQEKLWVLMAVMVCWGLAVLLALSRTVRSMRSMRGT